MRAYEVIGCMMTKPKRNLAFELIQYAIDNRERFDIFSDVNKLVVWGSMSYTERLAVEEMINEALK